jgi:poly(3-hydroxyalkanoate) depolymerase
MTMSLGRSRPRARLEWVTVVLPTLGRLRLRVSRRGAGEPVLLIMGLGGGLDMWQPLLDELDGVETIAVDAPGVGRSTTPYRPLSMVELAQVYSRLVRALGLDAVHVVGFSFGGAVAQQLALSHPAVVRSVVLVATGPGLGGVPGSPIALAELSTPWRYYSPRRFEEVAPFLYGGRLARDPRTLRQHVRRRMHAGPSWIGYTWQLTALVGWTSLPWLHRISAPTLVLAGDEDPVFPLENAQLLRRGIPDAQLEVVRGGGHLFVLDSAPDVAPLIHAFLQRNSAEDIS